MGCCSPWAPCQLFPQWKSWADSDGRGSFSVPRSVPPGLLSESPLQGLCPLAALQLGAIGHREQLLLQNKCPLAWEPRGVKGLGGRAPLGSSSLISSGCSCLRGQHPFCPLTPVWCPRFMDSAPGRATLPAQPQPLIPGGSRQWQCRRTVQPQLQWKESEVQSIPVQGLKTVGLILGWAPSLLPYNLISNPLFPMASGAAEPLKAVSSWGRMRLGLESMPACHRTCKGSQPCRGLPHAQAI